MIDVFPTAIAPARRLVAQAAGQAKDVDTGIVPALHALEELRIPLSNLSGMEGYQALLPRALTLAKARAFAFARETG